MRKNYSLKLIYQNDDFIVVEKPYGFRTHKVSDKQLGFVEMLAAELKTKLWVTHRLDKETSGLMIFAKNKEAASIFFDLFEQHKVQKIYHFVSHLKTENKVQVLKSFIEKNNHQFIQSTENESEKIPNSETEVERLQTISSDKVLYKATPKTGKPHQIRLHALLAGAPILGDHEHSGTPSFRLFLQASELKFTFKAENHHFKLDIPFSFTSLKTDLYAELQDSWNLFHAIYDNTNGQSYRLIHRSINNSIQVDIYGSVVWVYWYNDSTPTEKDLSDIHKFAYEKKLLWAVRLMTNRGKGVSHDSSQNLWYDSLLAQDENNSSWVAEENGVKAELRLKAGYSPGLFLDQRYNRLWVKENSKDKTVLNLFSYTSLFSVNAALGKATQVTTVDASPNFIEWSKKNFELNKLASSQYEFFVQDTLLFLEGSIKRNRKWDLIICDPPSFGRTKATIWKIEKDLPDLGQKIWTCLTDKGQVLFTCNYEKWSLSEVLKNFTKKIPAGKYQITALPITGFDFDPPDEFSNLTKGFILVKTK